jgi:hypothetical protein
MDLSDTITGAHEAALMSSLLRGLTTLTTKTVIAVVPAGIASGYQRCRRSTPAKNWWCISKTPSPEQDARFAPHTKLGIFNEPKRDRPGRPPNIIGRW